jgi:HEPN domain-containing protein
MNDETRTWLAYAHENLASAEVLLESELYNPCLQNVQQAVEKMLKAVLIEAREKPRKTHSIAELTAALGDKKHLLAITDDEIDLLDSIYLPSKCPLGSVLADFEPDQALCRRCLAVAERVKGSVVDMLGWDVSTRGF